jgi:hypothetical protein
MSDEVRSRSHGILSTVPFDQSLASGKWWKKGYRWYTSTYRETNRFRPYDQMYTGTKVEDLWKWSDVEDRLTTPRLTTPTRWKKWRKEKERRVRQNGKSENRFHVEQLKLRVVSTMDYGCEDGQISLPVLSFRTQCFPFTIHSWVR